MQVDSVEVDCHQGGEKPTSGRQVSPEKQYHTAWLRSRFAYTILKARDKTLSQAWLVYFWGRAVNHGVEEDIAKDRLRYWISRTPTFQEAVEVGRDMEQLKKLEIELKPWKASCGEIDIPYPWPTHL